jgi:hypothetical protein
VRARLRVELANSSALFLDFPPEGLFVHGIHTVCALTGA